MWRCLTVVLSHAAIQTKHFETAALLLSRMSRTSRKEHQETLSRHESKNNSTPQKTHSQFTNDVVSHNNVASDNYLTCNQESDEPFLFNGEVFNDDFDAVGEYLSIMSDIFLKQHRQQQRRLTGPLHHLSSALLCIQRAGLSVGPGHRDAILQAVRRGGSTGGTEEHFAALLDDITR